MESVVGSFLVAILWSDKALAGQGRLFRGAEPEVHKMMDLSPRRLAADSATGGDWTCEFDRCHRFSPFLTSNNILIVRKYSRVAPSSPPANPRHDPRDSHTTWHSDRHRHRKRNCLLQVVSGADLFRSRLHDPRSPLVYFLACSRASPASELCTSDALLCASRRRSRNPPADGASWLAGVVVWLHARPRKRQHLLGGLASAAGCLCGSPRCSPVTRRSESKPIPSGRRLAVSGRPRVA